MWKKFPENKPTEKGYYFTIYHNSELNEKFYKALWWSMLDDKWCKLPNWKTEPEIIAFIPESRNDYYVPCLMWAGDNVKEDYKDVHTSES